MDVSVAIGSYGSQSWKDASERAAASVVRLGRLPIRTIQVHLYDGTLAEARNAALEKVETEWVVHLDADDELEPGYFEAMEAGTADLRAPSVRYVRDGIERRPYVPKVAGHAHVCTADCLRDGNWLVVGTAVRAQMLRDVGGWREWPCYEDWDAWLRCWQAGATVEPVRDAVYRAHVDPNSRNRGQAMEFKNRVHRQIVGANFDEQAAA